MAEGSAPPRAHRLVIGVGNADRGDDAIGRIVAQRLAGRVPPDVRVLEHDGEATSLLEYLGEADTVYLIDAAVSGAAPGTIRRFDCVGKPLPRGALQMSTHGIGPSEAIELARALGRLPTRCVVFAIEAGRVGGGSELSPTLDAAAEAVVARIAEELAADKKTSEGSRSA